jgi:uncharacterized protein involved in type VI secretion and phage assembly
MSLYDVIGDIAEKQYTKSETGDSRINGVMVGLVAKNYDKDMPGRVCVTIPTRDTDANELQWARLVQPSSGLSWGHYFLPEVGDQVVLAFEGGNIEKPYVIGCVPKDSNKFLTKAADEDNQFKQIITKHGNTLAFEDNREGDGENDKITISTAGQGHSFLLDNENAVMRITDKDKANFIEIETEDGAMKITAASSLTIKVGDAISIVMNGESGTISIKAPEVNIETEKQFKATTGETLSLEGGSIKISATSILKASSNGAVSIGGAPIKIG